MADGSKLPLIRKVRLQCSVRGKKFTEEFIIYDAILGISFFKTNRCSLNFKEATLLMGNKGLSCVDRLGDLLVSNVQVMQDTIIPARSEVAIQAKLCNKISGTCGITGTKMNPKTPENILVA